MASKLLVVKLVSFMMLFAVSHAGILGFLKRLASPKWHPKSTPRPWYKPELPPPHTQSPTWHPKSTPWDKRNKPSPELPRSYTPTPELPPSDNPSPELPPSYTPTPELPRSYNPSPELPPSYMPTPELPAPSPAPY